MATGVWKGREAIAGHWKVDRRFEPQMSGNEATSIRARWKDAIGRSQGWAKDE
jgi:glycerol kinase